jgi:hypothetical protein
VDAGISVDATILDDHTLTCVAPEAETTSGGLCPSLLFNVAFGERSTDASNVAYQRPSSSTLVRAASSDRLRPLVKETADSVIVLHGAGFVNATAAS